MQAMKTIADEINEFIQATGIKQRQLAIASGVPASTICNLLSGKRKNVLGHSQDALRRAMKGLSTVPTPVVQEAGGE